MVIVLIKHRILSICLLLTLASSVSIGQGFEKLDYELYKLASGRALSNDPVHVLVQGDMVHIQNIVSKANGLIRYSYGDIASVIVTPAALAELCKSNRVARIERPQQQYELLNDSMRSTIQVNPVHLGQPPLGSSYKGSGIAIGIIDTGCDLTHPDLKDSTGNTRIKFIWDQRKPNAANTPQPFGYGQEWDEGEINAGNAQTNDEQGFGHGTHVSGIAAGDGSANGTNTGVAPEAVLIQVAINFNNTTNPTIMDAVNYIFTKAQQLGLPCIINASLGSYYGSHDGHDLQSLMIKNMITQQTGRTLVAAAGNAGNRNFHLGYNVTSDTSFTWVRHNPSYQFTYLQIWGDTATFNNIGFSVGADVNLTDPSFRGRTAFRNFNYSQGVPKKDTIFSPNGDRLAIIDFYSSLQGPACLTEMIIRPDSNSYQWRLSTTGSGKFDIWKFYDGAGTSQSGFQSTGLPSVNTVPDMVFYKYPDFNSTIVSGFQCLDEVITVGNHQNRTFYYDFNGNIYTDTIGTAGQIVANSSRGPTRDGRIKPDIAAPGSITLSSGQLSLLSQWQTIPVAVPLISQGGFHFRDGGTSSSAPVVAGVAALFQEAYPNADYAQIKNAIMQCAVQDSFTGNQLPNNTWGAGKVNALNTLLNCGLTSLAEPGFETPALVSPNPVSQGQPITVYSNIENAIVELFEISGRKALMGIPVVDWPVKIETYNLSNGVYLLTIRNDRQVFKTQRVVVVGR